MRIEYTQDVDLLEPLAESWSAECNGGRFGLAVSVPAALAELKNWLATMPGTLILGYEGDRLVGCFAVFKVPLPMAGRFLALEKYWYTLPGATLGGPALYRAARRWGRENECSHLVVSASNMASDLHDKVVQFCTHMGMQLFETAFIGEL